MRRQWLRELRRAQGMTQEDLAQRMGKERSAISKYEAGVCDLSSRVLQAYAEIFQVSLEELLGMTPRTQPDPAPLPPPPSARAALHALPPRRRRASRAPH
jgi:transcriptional regulator with XRE-family HTH domain